MSRNLASRSKIIHFVKVKTHAAPRHESPLLEPDITSNRDELASARTIPKYFTVLPHHALHMPIYDETAKKRTYA
jgi:hypothetical protein